MTILRPNFKPGLELPDLCSTIVRILCNGNSTWDTDRLINFSLFCNLLIIQMNIPPPILYTSLKYFQLILINNTNEYYNIIDLSQMGHEYSILTISLSLSYKYLDDNPPLLKQWAYVSMIPTDTLVALELQVLNTLGYSLSIPVDDLYKWTEQCNTIYESSLMSLECVDLFDLHETNHRFGYNTLLPVILDEYYILPDTQPLQDIIPLDQLWYLTPTSILM